jgi:DNA-binding transcriptional regulator YhcF (GntR family)
MDSDLLPPERKTSIGLKNSNMQFRESNAIYLQIADYICERILLQQWKAGERIPAVRELAVQLEVNPNTVMRTYEFLQGKTSFTTKEALATLLVPKRHKMPCSTAKQNLLKKNCPTFSGTCTPWVWTWKN